MSLEELNLQVKAIQFQVSSEPSFNYEKILGFIKDASEDEFLLFPEGSISGYSEDESEYILNIDFKEVESVIEKIEIAVQEKKIHVVIGTLRKENNRIFNTAAIISHSNPMQEYRKINLAISERDIIFPGNTLPVFSMLYKNNEIIIGIQICREIRFSEQWKSLSMNGAQVIFFLTYTTGNDISVWKSHLISRAAENQRYVISANVSHKTQQCPTMIISPKGKIQNEVISDAEIEIVSKIDLRQCSNWYLSQNRSDIVRIESGT